MLSAKYLSSSGEIKGSRTHVHGILVYPSDTSGTFEIKDGGAGGTSKTTTVTVPASAAPHFVPFGQGPDEHILCETSAYLALSNCSALVVYD